MKFLMSPGWSVGGGGNQYIDIICKALKPYGFEIHDWKPYIPFQTGMGFHLHWPQIFPIKIYNPKQKYIEPLFQYNLWKTIDDVKKKGGRLVWTVHDLKPHDAVFAEDPHWLKFIDRFSEAVDSYILLTPAAREDVLHAYPKLKNKSWGVAHHPHYRGTLAPASSVDYRKEFGISAQTVVLGMIGSMSAAKGVVDIIESFARASLPDCVLFLAGHCDQQTADLIEMKRSKGVDIRGVFHHLSQQEIVDFHKVIDMTIFPSLTHLNSGTVFQSLSCNVPVRLQRTPTNEYLAGLLSDGWLSFIGDEIIDRKLLDEVRLHRLRKDELCDLTAFDPDTVARQHIAVYFPEGLPK